MRKPLVPRFLVLLLLYLFFFTAMASIQFPVARETVVRAGRVTTEPEPEPELEPAPEITISPEIFILPAAGNREQFNQALNLWRNQNYSRWSSSVSTETREDRVIAFLGEALSRGNYRAALTAVPLTFLNGSGRTYESSVYLGGMTQARASLETADRETLARLTRLINSNSPEFFQEKRPFEFLAVRGFSDLMEAGAVMVGGMDPAVIGLDIVPGIFEGYMDWALLRPGRDNPLGNLTESALSVIFAALSLVQETAAGTDRVLVAANVPGEAEFNLRLGKALMDYSEYTNDEIWAGIGRSLVLSALSLEDAPDAAFFRILFPSVFLPRAAIVNIPGRNIWAWTAAQNISASSRDNGFDIAVSFPAGETHYMILRGIMPFVRIQLYNIDYRSAADFEIWDSSGWVYNAQEQTLLLKMRHREEIEYIRIFY